MMLSFPSFFDRTFLVSEIDEEEGGLIVMRPPSVRFYRSYTSGHAGLAEHRSRTRPWRRRGFGVPTEVGGARKMGL